jgi:hypothetical protein
MKRTLTRTLVAFMIFTSFLLPIIGNTVMSNDRSERTFYFDEHHSIRKWETNWGSMVDGDPDTYASTTIVDDEQLLTENTCLGTESGTITKVEIRAKGNWSGAERDIILQPLFSGFLLGDINTFDANETVDWSPWFVISDDTNSHTWWTWGNVNDLDCIVKVGGGSSGFTVYCSIVQIRVSYT